MKDNLRVQFAQNVIFATRTLRLWPISKHDTNQHNSMQL